MKNVAAWLVITLLSTNSYDFGPLGTELKNNLKQKWWKCPV